MAIQKVKAGKLTFYFGIEQGTQEWLDLRVGRVTCSNALTLLTRGKEFCKEANLLSAERTTPNGNGYAERGHVIEDEARNALNAQLEKSGYKLVTCAFITHDDYPDAGYSPDGLIVPIDLEDWWNYGEFTPAEFKAYNDVTERQGEGGQKVLVRSDKHKKAAANLEDVPLVARCQCQMEMLMCDAKECFLILANPDATGDEPKIAHHIVKRDEKVCQRLADKLTGKIK